MGSDLYVSVEIDNRTGVWSRRLFGGPSTELARGIVVEAFGSGAEASSADSEVLGYLPHAQWDALAAFEDTPWIRDEPYWIRKLDGQVFCDIIREKRWRTIQKNPDGGYDFDDLECGDELRAFAALVRSLLDDGRNVRVWCWHAP